MPHAIEWPTCELCGIRHNPDHPHAATTSRYQTWFFREHGRAPTYADAMAHCAPEVKALYREAWRSIDPTWDADDVADMDFTVATHEGEPPG